MHETTDISTEIIEAVADKKGSRIAVVDLSGIDGASTSTLIICQGRNPSQVSAIADNVRERVFKNRGVKPVNYEGYRNSQWIIIDYGHIMVHVFLPDMREFYSLESLWNDAPIEFLPDID